MRSEQPTQWLHGPASAVGWSRRDGRILSSSVDGLPAGDPQRVWVAGRASAMSCVDSGGADMGRPRVKDGWTLDS